MNERIKELMRQAGTDTSGKWMGVDHAERFAELIVKDTINIMKQEWYDRNNASKVEGETPRDIGLRIGAKSQTIRLMHMVQKHFGVEE